VTEAIGAENQEAATLEKTALEDEQRRAVAERAEAGTTWLPKHFIYVSIPPCLFIFYQSVLHQIIIYNAIYIYDKQLRMEQHGATDTKT